MVGQGRRRASTRSRLRPPASYRNATPGSPVRGRSSSILPPWGLVPRPSGALPHTLC